MTIQEITHLFRDIMINYPQDDEIRQLKTFRVFSDRTQLNASNLGANFVDYEYGSYWNRHFVHSGEDQNEIVKEYGILGIQWNEFSKPHYNSKDTDFILDLMIFDSNICVCSDEERSDLEVDEDISKMLLNVISELMTYGVYQQGTERQWMSKGKAAYLNANGANWGMVRSILPYIKLEAIRPQLVITGIDKVRGVTTPIVFHKCNLDKIDFNYNHPTIEQVGNIQCSTC